MLIFLCLESEQEQESHHEAEKSHSLGQGESQNGKGEELSLEGGIPGVADDQRAEHAADAGAWGDTGVQWSFTLNKTLYKTLMLAKLLINIF